MEKYNYFEAVTADVLEAIRENYTPEEVREKLRDRAAFAEELNEKLWTDDAVTGNASGSYTFNAWRAEEYIAHNLELLAEALGEFGDDAGAALDRGAEYCDVTVRCYLLVSAIAVALEALETEAGE